MRMLGGSAFCSELYLDKLLSRVEEISYLEERPPEDWQAEQPCGEPHAYDQPGSLVVKWTQAV